MNSWEPKEKAPKKAKKGESEAKRTAGNEQGRKQRGRSCGGQGAAGLGEQPASRALAGRDRGPEGQGHGAQGKLRPQDYFSDPSHALRT